MTTKINRKKLAAKLKWLKERALSEHSEMVFAHVDVAYMVTRAKEEIMTNGDTDLALTLLLLAKVKSDGP